MAGRTILGLPSRLIVPVAGGVVLVASLAVALLFLMPGQGPAQQLAVPTVNKLAEPRQSAEAQPPRNADPSLVLSPSDLSYRSGKNQ